MRNFFLANAFTRRTERALDFELFARLFRNLCQSIAKHKNILFLFVHRAFRQNRCFLHCRRSDEAVGSSGILFLFRQHNLRRWYISQRDNSGNFEKNHLWYFLLSWLGSNLGFYRSDNIGHYDYPCEGYLSIHQR